MLLSLILAKDGGLRSNSWRNISFNQIMASNLTPPNRVTQSPSSGMRKYGSRLYGHQTPYGKLSRTPSSLGLGATLWPQKQLGPPCEFLSCPGLSGKLDNCFVRWPYLTAMAKESLKHRIGPYRLYAPVYDRVFAPSFSEGHRKMYQSLDLEEGDRILEVGVGTGISLA